MRMGFGFGIDVGAPNPLSLFSGGEQGFLYDLTTLYQDSAGTTPVTALGQPVGRVLDKSGRGNHGTQATASKRPVLPAVGARLRSDFTDDALVAPSVGAAELYVKTPYGSYRAADLSAGASNLPLNDATQIIARAGTLTDAQRNSIFAYFGGNKKYMVALSPDTTIANLRIFSGGAATPLLFVGANGATVTKTLSLNSDTSYDVSADGLTAPVAVVWPESLISSSALTAFYCSTNQLTGSIPSLSANTALTLFSCYANQLTGSIPSLSANTALTVFSCHTNQLTGSIPSLSANTALSSFVCAINQLTGSIPSLSANTALTQFYCYANQLTGSIPSLSANTALTQFYCYANQLTGWTGGTVSATLGDFQAQNNLLPAASVNAILAAFVAAGRTTGTRILNLGGTGNAAPTGQGITDKTTLVSRGWTVTTN